MSSWATGALLSIFGSTAGNLGVNVQKHSLMREGKRALEKRRAIWKQKEYIAGLCLIILGSLGDFAALSMVAQSIVAPLGSVTLVVNIFFAHFWLKEQVGWREIIGTAFIITGSTLSVVFGNHENPSYTNDELLDLISGGLFIAYLVVILSLMVVGVTLHLRVSPWKRQLVEMEAAVMRNNKKQQEQQRRGSVSGAAAVSGSTPAKQTPVVPTPQGPVLHEERPFDAEAAQAAMMSPTHKMTVAAMDTANRGTTLVPTEPSKLNLNELPALQAKFRPWARFHPFILCALSGTFGAQSILFSKCFSVLLSTSLEGNNQMWNFFPWVCFIGMLICIFTQLYFMAQALSVYDSLYCVPVFQTFFIFIAAMGGAAYFREVQDFSLVQAIMFPVGFALTLTGVGVLTLRSRDKKKPIPKKRKKNSADREDGLTTPLSPAPARSDSDSDSESDNGDTDSDVESVNGRGGAPARSPNLLTGSAHTHGRSDAAAHPGSALSIHPPPSLDNPGTVRGGPRRGSGALLAAESPLSDVLDLEQPHEVTVHASPSAMINAVWHGDKGGAEAAAAGMGPQRSPISSVAVGPRIHEESRV